jgi:hypothetical protein
VAASRRVARRAALCEVDRLTILDKRSVGLADIDPRIEVERAPRRQSIHDRYRVLEREQKMTRVAAPKRRG